jgi:hypothetical protein
MHPPRRKGYNAAISAQATRPNYSRQETVHGRVIVRTYDDETVSRGAIEKDGKSRRKHRKPLQRVWRRPKGSAHE